MPADTSAGSEDKEGGGDPFDDRSNRRRVQHKTRRQRAPDRVTGGRDTIDGYPPARTCAHDGGRAVNSC